MASAQIKPQENEEETSVIEQIHSLPSEKRKREEQTPSESPTKYRQTTDGNRSVAKSNKSDSLAIPFWKTLNRSQSSAEFHPIEMGTFSLLTQGDEKQCFEDKRYLRIYKYPLETLTVNFDLKIGESDFISEDKSKNINAMLWWLLQHKEKIFRNNQFTFDFLSWRGVLRLIMFSIAEKYSDWSIAVIKFKNAYFLCEYVTDMQTKSEQNMTPENRSFSYYGHKFEEYVTKNHSPTEIINPLKQFTGVFQSTIGSYRLLYGAEMDCVLEKSSSTTEHIELKVCAGKSLSDLPFLHNRKYAKWWIQSFLVGSCEFLLIKAKHVFIEGIKTMVIGLRDNNGIVNKISPLNISEIERATITWSRQAFLNFFVLFANFLKEHVIEEYSLDRKEVTLFQFLPSSCKITVKKSSDPKYHFLSDEFFNEFQ